MNEKELLVKFKRDVFDRFEEIDPGDEQDWFSMAVGYFLAFGVEVQRAYELASPAALGKTEVPKRV